MKYPWFYICNFCANTDKKLCIVSNWGDYGKTSGVFFGDFSSSTEGSILHCTEMIPGPNYNPLCFLLQENVVFPGSLNILKTFMWPKTIQSLWGVRQQAIQNLTLFGGKMEALSSLLPLTSSLTECFCQVEPCSSSKLSIQGKRTMEESTGVKHQISMAKHPVETLPWQWQVILKSSHHIQTHFYRSNSLSVKGHM